MAPFGIEYSDGLQPIYPVATAIFLAAILHSFLTGFFARRARRLHLEHLLRIKQGLATPHSMGLRAGLFEFLSEIEVVFGLWVVVLAFAFLLLSDWKSFVEQIAHRTDYTEPMFVIVIMFIASTRPVLKFAELMLWKITKLAGGTLPVWWLTILTIGPLLGSIVTEPAAMTICAHLLAGKFFDLDPSPRLKYATIALLFVNISIGGLLTNFSAVPVIMVAEPWNWSLSFMFLNFGTKAMLIVAINNAAYYLLFRRELDTLQNDYKKQDRAKSIVGRFIHREEIEKKIQLIEKSAEQEAKFVELMNDKYSSLKEGIRNSIQKKIKMEEVDPEYIDRLVEETMDEIKKHELNKTIPGITHGSIREISRDPDWDTREEWVPYWAMFVHLLFFGWTVANAHEAVLFISGFLFLIGFMQITPQYQNRINFRQPLLVGFFLSGLVIHAGMQKWWIAPMIKEMGELPLLIGSIVLTSFNDNAAITYMATQVPGLTDTLKYLIMCGAVAGGGTTIFANAPNPAGIAILKKYYSNGFSSIALFLWAIFPTIVAGTLFYLLR